MFLKTDKIFSELNKVPSGAESSLKAIKRGAKAQKNNTKEERKEGNAKRAKEERGERKI